MDEELLRRAQGGNREAIDELTEQMEPLLKQFAMKICKHPDAADDAAQEALLTFATRLDDFEGRAALSTWAYTLARTACARQRRGLKNAPGLPLSSAPEPVDEASPESEAIDHETTLLVSAAIDELSPEHREVITLRDIDGLDTHETCQRLSLSPEAMKSRLHRARAALAERLLGKLREGRGAA